MIDLHMQDEDRHLFINESPLTWRFHCAVAALLLKLWLVAMTTLSSSG